MFVSSRRFSQDGNYPYSCDKPGIAIAPRITSDSILVLDVQVLVLSTTGLSERIMKPAAVRHVLSIASKEHYKDMSDGELLNRYIESRDQEAFATIVDRYSSLVWRTIRLTCSNNSFTEDAHQATFLVLSRKASTIRESVKLPSWLHHVARRISIRENRNAHRPLPTPAAHTRTLEPIDQLTSRELLQFVEEQIEQLPEIDRSVLLLCSVENLSHEVAAQRLGIPVGALRGRLDRSRQRLRAALSKKGMTIPLIFVGTATAPQSVIANTISIAQGTPYPAVVEQLARDAIHDLKPFFFKAKFLAASSSLVFAVVVGQSLFAQMKEGHEYDRTTNVPHVVSNSSIMKVSKAKSEWTLPFTSDSDLGDIPLRSSMCWMNSKRYGRVILVAGTRKPKHSESADPSLVVPVLNVIDPATSKLVNSITATDLNGNRILLPCSGSGHCCLTTSTNRSVVTVQWIFNPTNSSGEALRVYNNSIWNTVTDDFMVARLRCSISKTPACSRYSVGFQSDERDSHSVGMYISNTPYAGEQQEFSRSSFPTSFQVALPRMDFPVGWGYLYHPCHRSYVATSRALLLVDPKSRKTLQRIDFDHVRVRDIVFSPTLSQAIIGGNGNQGQSYLAMMELRLINPKSLDCSIAWELKTDPRLAPSAQNVTKVAFHPSGKSVVAAFEDGRLRAYRAASGEILFETDPLNRPIRDITFSSDGAKIYSLDDRSITCWNVE